MSSSDVPRKQEFHRSEKVLLECNRSPALRGSAHASQPSRALRKEPRSITHDTVRALLKQQQGHGTENEMERK